MSALLADLAQAARALRRRPLVPAAAIAALALGIGASTAVFSVTDAVMLRPLPFAAPDRLVLVGESSAARGQDFGVLSALLFGVAPRDPATLAGAAAVLALVALLACAVPALRAARIDPAAAMRRE